jgi:hypothetical protein
MGLKTDWLRKADTKTWRDRHTARSGETWVSTEHLTDEEYRPAYGGTEVDSQTDMGMAVTQSGGRKMQFWD